MDLSDPDSVRKCIREIQPGLIVNAAAYTAVDKAEAEPDLAMMVNGTPPHHGGRGEAAGCRHRALLHRLRVRRQQSHALRRGRCDHPINVYGRSKLAGEEAIQAVGAPHLILRTSWVYGARGKNFLLTILRLARERDELKIVDDQFGAPTWSRTIAETTAQMLAQRRSAAALAEVSGVYHLTAVVAPPGMASPKPSWRIRRCS